MWKKQILVRAIRIQNEPWRVTAPFSEIIIELKFGKKLPYYYIRCILTLFLELWLLNYLWKMPGYPHFSFWIPINLAIRSTFPLS